MPKRLCPRRKPGPAPFPFLEGLKARSVNLDDDTVALAKVLGDGNVSAGLREAVRVAYRLRQSR